DHAHAALAENPDGAVPLRARERACLAPSRPRRAPGRHLPGGRVLRSVRRPSVRPQASLATTTLWRPVSDFTRPDGMAYYPRHVGREFGRLADPSRARSLPPAPRLGASRRDRAIPRGGALAHRGGARRAAGVLGPAEQPPPYRRTIRGLVVLDGAGLFRRRRGADPPGVLARGHRGGAGERQHDRHGVSNR